MSEPNPFAAIRDTMRPRTRKIDEAIDAAEAAYLVHSCLLADYKRVANRIIVLDREPRRPSGGGMSTGDTIEVGIRDWYGLLRLAKWVAR